MMGILGALALVIAVIGIYGIVAYTVAVRTREFGVRMALGARRGDIFTLVIGDAIRLSAWGAGVGVTLAIPVSKMIGAVAFGAASGQAMSVVAIAALLALTTTAACLAPARRAMHADPITSLKCE